MHLKVSNLHITFYTGKYKITAVGCLIKSLKNVARILFNKLKLKGDFSTTSDNAGSF